MVALPRRHPGPKVALPVLPVKRGAVDTISSSADDPFVRYTAVILALVALVGLALAGWVLTGGPAPGEGDPPGALGAEELARFQALLEDGARLLEEGDPMQSRAALEEALRIRPGDPEAIRLLGTSYRKGMNLQKALDLLRSGVDSHPDDASLRLERGRCLEEMGDFRGARDDFRFALDRDPSHPGAHIRLGWVELKLNRFGEAIRAARRSLELGLDDPEVHLLIGAASTGEGDSGTAEAEFRTCLDRNPGLLEARYRLGRLLVKEGREVEGEAELERAARQSRLVVEIERLEGLGETYRAYEQRNDPKRDRMLSLALELGEAYLSALRFDQAEELTRQALLYHPDSAGLSWILGVAALGQGRDEESLRLLQQAAARDPASERAREAVRAVEARIRVEGGERGPVVVLVEKLLEESPR